MSFEQTIYDRLRKDGLSEAGALGVLGNWDCESNCEPYRVQGDFSSYRSISRAYVNALESGQLSKYNFAHDQKGFGLAQWTYPTRKEELYDYWKQHGGKIDSADLQTDFAVHEMQRDYPGLYKFLRSTNDIHEACARVCREFERPAVNNIEARFQSACRIKNEIDLNGGDGQEEDKPSEPDTDDDGMPIPETWPPRTIDCHCSGWPEVWLLQAVLKCRGYNVLVDGIWGQVLTEKTKEFQREHGLDADAVVGPMTWGKLLERK